VVVVTGTVPVVGAAATVKLVVAQDRRPRTGAFGPAHHFRLLVEVAIEQDRVRALAGNFDEDDGRASGKLDDLKRCAGQRPHPFTCPTFQQRNRIAHIAVLFPIGIEGRRFVGNTDVFDECGNDRIVPDGVDECPKPLGVHQVRPSQ